MNSEVFLKIAERDNVQVCPRWSCGENMERQFNAPAINNGTRSPNSFAPYRRAFGNSVDKWNTVGDMDKHIKAKNKEFGLNIEPLGSD